MAVMTRKTVSFLISTVQVLIQAFAFKATLAHAHNHWWDCVLSCQHSLTSHGPAEFCLLGKQNCFVKTEADNFSWSKLSSYSWSEGSIWGTTLLPLRNFTSLSAPATRTERGILPKRLAVQAVLLHVSCCCTQPALLSTACLFSVIIRWSSNLTYSLLATKNCFDSSH